MGEGRFCSEAAQAKVRTQHGPCPWRAWLRSSWPPVVLPHEGEGCWRCVQTCPCHSQAQPRSGVSPGPRPQLRPNGRGGAERGCLHTVAAQGTRPSGREKKGETGWMAKPSLSQQPQGSKESKRPSVPLGQLCPFPPGWCCWGLPRSCLTTSGSAELSEGAGGRNRRVHMLKP